MPAGSQESIYGNQGDYHFAPGKIYIKTTSGFIPQGYAGANGTGIDIGKTGPIEIKKSVTYVDAFSIQTGSTPDDKAVGGQVYEISTTLKEIGLNILENVSDGFSVERDTDDQPIRYGEVLVIGKRKRVNAFRMTYVEMADGLELWTRPEKIVDFFVTIPLVNEAVATVDAENFREYAVMFQSLVSSTDKDYLNRPFFFASRSNPAP